jgi:hypothetical protein
MIRFFRSLAPFGRWVVGIGLALFLLAVIGGVRSCQMASTAKTEAKLSANQAGAALASGKDAVDTLGKTAAAEANTDTITEENERAIRQAPGADAPVDPAVHDAGLRSLCRRAAYRGKPECVQFAPAK